MFKATLDQHGRTNMAAATAVGAQVSNGERFNLRPAAGVVRSNDLSANRQPANEEEQSWRDHLQVCAFLG